ncbi:L-histidine N(alpha)-methyltransferase [Nanoarchaeota archaeon]
MSVTKEKPKINDLIFKELIKRGYSLEGNTRVWNIADSKLWYLTPEQAQAFLDLEQSVDYQKEVIQKEIDLINGNMEVVINKIKDCPINVIDLGCGDGKKAALFLEKLKDKIKIRYCPIDISGYMIEKAVDEMTKLGIGEVVEFKWNISDFENVSNITSLLIHGSFKKNLILLLGNTLGNFEINEFLYSIKSSMKEGDYLIIGNGLDNRKVKDILRSYDSDEVNNFLKWIPIRIGLKENEVELGVRFANSRVELYYTLKKDKKISFQNRTINFSKGDQIIVAVSYKYDEYDFKSFLTIYFKETDMFVSKDKSYAFAICQK